MVLMSDSGPDQGETAALALALYRVLYDAGVSFESNAVVPLLVAAVRSAGWTPPVDTDHCPATIAVAKMAGLVLDCYLPREHDGTHRDSRTNARWMP